MSEQRPARAYINTGDPDRPLVLLGQGDYRREYDPGESRIERFLRHLLVSRAARKAARSSASMRPVNRG